MNTLFQQLERRRRELGWTYSQLAKRSGLSQITLFRMLSQEHPGASFENVVRAADSLGVTLGIVKEKASVHKILLNRAEQKARELVGMLQGTSALEGQGLDDAHLRELRDQTVHELMAGSKRTLWGE